MKNFAERLEHAIAKSGKPKGELARHTGVALSTVSRWLGGTTPGSDKIAQIANFLGVDAIWLIYGDEGRQILHSEDPIAGLREEPAQYPALSEKREDVLLMKLLKESPPEWLLDRLDHLSKEAAEGDINSAVGVRLVALELRERLSKMNFDKP